MAPREHPLPAAFDEALPDGIVAGEGGHHRCSWAVGVPGFGPYHDSEWGFPVADEHRLFEKLCLEGFQSGLSWRTILNKRPAFREVFLDFDFERVARFGSKDVEQLMGDARIVRHRGKIEATIHNAQRALELADAHGSLGAFIWAYEPAVASRPERLTQGVLQALSKTEASTRLSRDLKKLGWRFFGPTTAYAFMQAMGLVNDHIEGCFVREPCEQAREAFGRPRSRCAHKQGCA